MMFSVVIPCYNASSFIEHSLESLFFQSYTNWEAICVNDGSIDNTLVLLEKYAKKDSRIRIYTQTNQGAAEARTYGVMKAIGNYILFLDADDELSFDALQVIVNRLKDDPDIIVSGFNIIKKGHIVRTQRIFFDKLDKLSYLKAVLCGKYGWELCGKVYKRELFDNPMIIPKNIRIGEDASVFIQIVTHAERIVNCDYAIYNYIQNSHSASHIRSLRYAEETLIAACFIEDYLKQCSFYKEIESEISAMFLLFYSNSTFKAVLSNKHELIQYVRKKHLKMRSLLKLPIIKIVYIILICITNGLIAKCLNKG